MPTLTELRRLDSLEEQLGVVYGSAGVATVEVSVDGPIPLIEIEDFKGLTVIVRSGAIQAGEYRCTVNGEWRAGLPPQRFDAVANDHEFNTRESTHKDRLEQAIRDAHRQQEGAQDRRSMDGGGVDVPAPHARATGGHADPHATPPDGVPQTPAPMPVPPEPSYIINMATGRRTKI